MTLQALRITLLAFQQNNLHFYTNLHKSKRSKESNEFKRLKPSSDNGKHCQFVTLHVNVKGKVRQVPHVCCP